MGYMHVPNLYKEQDILMFKECYVLEKIHGTSAHISYKDGNLTFFSGGEKHSRFAALFNEEELLTKLKALLAPDQDITIFGEAYGGSQQKMSATYGNELKFVAFDVQINDYWLSVPDAEKVCQDLGIEFVYYCRSSTNLDELNAHRDRDSVQAIRNGVGPGKKMEGVVLRPIIELKKNNGSRIIVKHKRDEFKETKTPRVVDEATLKVLTDANNIAEEWVTPMRLNHVLDKIPDHDISKMPVIIKAMIEDVYREAAGEIVEGNEVSKAISKKTVTLYKSLLKNSLLTE